MGRLRPSLHDIDLFDAEGVGEAEDRTEVERRADPIDHQIPLANHSLPDVEARLFVDEIPIGGLSSKQVKEPVVQVLQGKRSGSSLLPANAIYKPNNPFIPTRP